jgi:hypothetical protein
MPERDSEYVRRAAECTFLARQVQDPASRRELLHLAQKWIELAMAPCHDIRPKADDNE